VKLFIRCLQKKKSANARNHSACQTDWIIFYSAYFLSDPRCHFPDNFAGSPKISLACVITQLWVASAPIQNVGGHPAAVMVRQLATNPTADFWIAPKTYGHTRGKCKMITTTEIPTLADIQATRARLGDLVVETPIWRWRSPEVSAKVGEETEIFLKLELFQATGSFKPRGALSVMLGLDPATLARGVTAVSAGNHAIAVAYAAQLLGTTAKVVMPKTANPARVATCRRYGAEVVLTDDVQAAFVRVEQIQQEEGRHFVHPFEGRQTILGTATVGLEFATQVPALDAVIIPIGGGGLCAGMATAIKQVQPSCQIFGVEPEGADTMRRSFQAGSPQRIERVKTIADSLGSPMALPYSFGLCQHFVDDLVLVSDDEMRQAMALLFGSMGTAARAAGRRDRLWRQYRQCHLLPIAVRNCVSKGAPI
jgi:threonine dehydratase